MARKLTANGTVYRRLIVPLSRLSFGMYLLHIFVLTIVFSFMTEWFGHINPWAGTPLIIMLTATCTFVLSALATKLLSLLPGSRYIVGT